MKRILTLTLLAAGAIASMSAETARWLREPAISPDGSKIAFTYKGDIFVVPTAGGTAMQLTSDRSYDGTPIWTPDGKNIVFTSNREGSDDIFITSATGGTPRRLTTSSGTEKPLTFINENTLLFNTSGLPGRTTARAPFMTQIYQIDVTKPSPRPKLYLSLPVVSADANKNGELLYQDRKGVEDVLRKHERSSGTADVWLYDKGKFSQLTNFNGGDQSPVWGKGDTFYYVSEKNGTLNVFEGNIKGGQEKQLTDFTRHPVRTLSSSDNGLLAFAWDGDLYTLVPGQQPRKVDVDVVADNYDGDRVKNYMNRGAQNLAVSPEGKEVAFTIRGDLYVTSADYKTTKRITDTSAQERIASFSPDGRTIVFDSDVNGVWQLFTAKIKNPDEKQFAYASEIEIEPLYKCSTSAMRPAFSPDGKKVAFLENRTEIKVIDLATKKVNTALDGKWNYSYSDGDVTFSWSPDSEWILAPYIGEGGWNNIDVALVKADGSQVVDLTESGHSDGDAKWALDGRAITYGTSKYGMKAQGSWGSQSDLVFMALDPDAWEKFNFTKEEAELSEKAEKAAKEKEKESQAKDGKDKKGKKGDQAKEAPVKKSEPFDLANRRYRTKRLSNRSDNYGSYYLTPKGDKLYFVAGSPDGSWNTYMTDLKSGDTKIVLPGVAGQLIPDKKGDFLFTIANGGIKKINLNSSKAENVDFEAPYDRKPSLEREYMFDHMSKQVADKFYDENLHGVDWDYYTKHYREFLPYISNNRDFATLLSEILGELNASHTGGRAYGSGAPLSTAQLGAYFDEDYAGEGLKVAEVFPRGPLSTKAANIQPGDIILSIDGVTIAPECDYFPLLEGKSGKKVRLEVKKANGKKEYVTVKPSNSQNELAYQRWIEHNEHVADSLSGGRIGYVHVRGMNTQSYIDVYDRILGKYRNCDAVVVDTRHNGGGWLHNDLAILLNGKKYVTFMPRGRKIGEEPFAQWHKPSVMLIDESNYSDAHGSPYTYKALGIGETVGAPIPGTMTAVWWENQIDPSIVFGIPQVTNVSNDGVILENTQFNPDVLIYNDPADIESGRDAQLEGAVKRLLETVDKNKK